MLDATQLTLVPRTQGVISDMDGIAGMPVHEVVMELAFVLALWGQPSTGCFHFLCTRDQLMTWVLG